MSRHLNFMSLTIALLLVVGEHMSLWWIPVVFFAWGMSKQ
jgi:hypothetical protein